MPEVMERPLIKINLHSGQEKIWLSEKPYLALIAGTGGGKTVFGVWYLAKMMEENPGGIFLAVSPTYRLQQRSQLPTFMEYFTKLDPKAEYLKSDNVWKSRRGTVYFGSADDPVKMEGVHANFCWLDEAGQMAVEMWEVAQRRVALKQGKILLTSTPYKYNWFKTLIYDRWKAGDPDIEVSQFSSIINPYYPHSEYERMRRTLPRWKFALFCKGEFEKPAGLIYDSFNEVNCKIPNFPIPKEWPIHSGHDFGITNPAAVFYAVEPGTGLIYTFAEYKPLESKSVAEQV